MNEIFLWKYPGQHGLYLVRDAWYFAFMYSIDDLHWTAWRWSYKGNKVLHWNIEWNNTRTVVKTVSFIESPKPFKDEAQIALFKDPVRTAQETLFISVIKPNQFMM